MPWKHTLHRLSFLDGRSVCGIEEILKISFSPLVHQCYIPTILPESPWKCNNFAFCTITYCTKCNICLQNHRHVPLNTHLSHTKAQTSACICTLCVWVCACTLDSWENPTLWFAAIDGICLCVCQSFRRPLRNLTMMRMASSITKTSQTAWGPWATCLQRWSSLRSSSKSRWNVSIYLAVCIYKDPFLPKRLKHACIIDGSLSRVQVWMCESCVCTNPPACVLSCESLRTSCLPLELGTFKTF